MFYETPQFIKQETKLMGIITFNQLWILVGLGGFLVILFFTLNLGLWLIAALILGPIGIFLTFGQMNGQPMYKVLPSALRHFWLPKYYFWQKEKPIVSLPSHSQETKPTVVTKTTTKKLDQQTLENLSQFLDQ